MENNGFKKNNHGKFINHTTNPHVLQGLGLYCNKKDNSVDTSPGVVTLRILLSNIWSKVDFSRTATIISEFCVRRFYNLREIPDSVCHALEQSRQLNSIST